VRDGVPLPGLTPPEVVSQLAHRVFGPLQPNRVRQVLDYHGLAGHPAGTRGQVAARHHVTSATVSNQVRTVRAAGARLPVTTMMISAVTRRSGPTEDHVGRVRIADTLGLPRPAPPEPANPPIPRIPQSGSSAGPKITRAAAQVLSAVDPLDLHTLLTAVERFRRFRNRKPLTATDLAAALTTIGAVPGPDGHWAAPPSVTAPDRYRVIVATGGGRDLTRADMIDVLITAGYSRNSANGRMTSSHPLFPGRPRPVPGHQPTHHHRQRRAAGWIAGVIIRWVGPPATDPTAASSVRTPS
jgi:hypothetical protein